MWRGIHLGFDYYFEFFVELLRSYRGWGVIHCFCGVGKLDYIIGADLTARMTQDGAA